MARCGENMAESAEGRVQEEQGPEKSLIHHVEDTFGLVFSVSTEHKRSNFTNKPHFYSTELLLILPRYTPSIMPHKKRFTKETAKMEASQVSKSDRQQIPPAIRSAATVMSEISGNSLLSIGNL
jgi:hypothetical protein